MSDTKKLIAAAVILVLVLLAIFIGTKTNWVTFPEAIQKAENKSATPTPAESKQVVIQNYSYNPTNLVVKVGETVTWVNQDSVAHTATANDGSFDTGLISQNQSASVTFNTKGTFSYHCIPHPQMTGTIIVE